MICVSALICELALAPVLAADTAFERHFDVSPGGQLTLDTDVGSVLVVGGDGHELSVHATVMGSADFRSHFSITAVQTPQGVTVTGRMQRPGWFGQWFESSRRNVAFSIEVPRDYATDIHTSGGALDLRHLNAATRGITSGGSVTVEDVHGPVRMRTSGGGIDVSDCTGDVDVRTSGGSIRLDDIDGSVRAATSGGSVHADVRSNQGVSLQTFGGSIALLLPATATGSLDAQTGGGHVESTIPLTSVESVGRNELRGAINGGGEQIRLRTAGGSIRIATLD